MITKQDGFTYFVDSFEGDNGDVSIEYKFRALDDGNFEVYSKDITNRFIASEYKRLDTRIVDGKQNIILKQFIFSLNQAIAQNTSKRTKSTKGRIAIVSGDKAFNFMLENEIKQLMIDNNISLASFIRSAIREKLEREDLL